MTFEVKPHSPSFRYIIPAGLAINGVFNKWYAGKALDETHYIPFNSIIVVNNASQKLLLELKNVAYFKNMLGGQMAIIKGEKFVGWSLTNVDSAITDNVVEVLVQYEPSIKDYLKAIYGGKA